MKFKFFEGKENDVFQQMCDFSETANVRSLGFENLEGSDSVVACLGYDDAVNPKRVSFKRISGIDDGFVLANLDGIYFKRISDDEFVLELNDEDYVCHALCVRDGVKSIILMQYDIAG